MARRRYLSTTISIDPRVADLANESGPFAALLYTWLIPHADDQGVVAGSPRQIKLQVVPGIDELGVKEISAALAAMRGLALIEWDGEVLRFPQSFHRYQSYIKEGRREVSAVQRKTPQNAANSGDAAPPAQLVAPVSSSFPVSSSLATSRRIASIEPESANGTASSSTPQAPSAPVTPARAEERSTVVPIDADIDIEPLDFQTAAAATSKPRRAPNSKLGEVIEIIQASGVPLATNPRDGKAVKGCNAPPADIAAAYVARARGEWVPFQLQDSFAIYSVVNCLAGYLTRNVPSKTPARRLATNVGLPAGPNPTEEYDEARRDYQRSIVERDAAAGRALARQGGHA